MRNNNKPIEAFLYWSPQSSFRMYDKKIILSVDNSSGKSTNIQIAQNYFDNPISGHKYYSP